MKQLLHILLIAVLMVFNILLIGKNYSLRKSFGHNSNIIENLKMKIEFYQEKNMIECSDNNMFLDEDTKLVDIEGNLIDIKKIVRSTKLIFRYSVLACNACVDVELENINKLISESKIDINNMCLFVYYENNRDLISTYRALQQNIPVYVITNNDLGLAIDKQNIPYYFIIDSTLYVNNIFVPKRTEIELTEHYITSIFKNIFGIEI